MYKKTALALTAFALSMNANARLIINKAYVETGEQFSVKAVHNIDEYGDIYVGILRANNSIAAALPKNAAGVATPKLANVYLNNAHYIFNLTIPVGLSPGGYSIFEIVTVPGGNPLDVNDWVNGFDSIDVIRGHLDSPLRAKFDTDGNGFADDDPDQDGFHKDDSNLDGYHDDDANHDGYHDDDSNHDGYHDDDLNHDGHHDDDSDHDGYHDDDSNYDGYHDESDSSNVEFN